MVFKKRVSATPWVSGQPPPDRRLGVFYLEIEKATLSFGGVRVTLKTENYLRNENVD